jgi:hypothetical protein
VSERATDLTRADQRNLFARHLKNILDPIAGMPAETSAFCLARVNLFGPSVQVAQR